MHPSAWPSKFKTAPSLAFKLKKYNALKNEGINEASLFTGWGSANGGGVRQIGDLPKQVLPSKFPAPPAGK